MIVQLKTDAANFRMANFYVSSLLPRAEYHAQVFKKILENLEQNNVVFHCSAGKDRTGIMAALIHRILGVSDEDIVADYVMTAELLAEYSQHHRKNYEQYRIPAATIDNLLGAQQENILEMLAHLDAHFPTTEDYLRSGGVTDAELDSFKNLMLG